MRTETRGLRWGRPSRGVVPLGAMLALLVVPHSVSAQEDARSYDVVVYGGTAAGALAAIAAAGEGARVALLEPGNHIGGMVSGGLSHTDLGDRRVIGGLALRFFERVAEHYGVGLWHYQGPEPGVAERIFRDWLEEAGVDVFFGRRIQTALRDSAGGRISRVAMVGDSGVFAGRVFIDASYEGDLMARAGVSYVVGREAKAQYGESWAGRQPFRYGPFQFPSHRPISPFADDSGARGPRVEYREGPLLPLIHDRPVVGEGEADGGVSPYGFRLCVTDRADNLVPFPRPEDYDPTRFELMRRWLATVGNDYELDWLLYFGPGIPNDKYDVNAAGPLSTNLLDGSNWRYPDADYEERRRIWDDHLSYTQGLLFFLANDPAVPERVRTKLNNYGLCKDEFADTGHWPHQLYVRAARRMVGEYVLTQSDLEKRRRMYDGVGLGSHHIDPREVQRVWRWSFGPVGVVGETVNEGFMRVLVEPYEIPFRTLMPRFAEADNVLVPVALSASHIAYSSIRMEPQYMILGHAAGVAAAMAWREDTAVQQVDVGALRQRLREQGQVVGIEQLPPRPERRGQRQNPGDFSDTRPGPDATTESFRTPVIEGARMQSNRMSSRHLKGAPRVQ